MIHEHAITVKDHISIEQLNYLIKKANKLGNINRLITSVYMEEDQEGKHYYFLCEGPKHHVSN